MKVGGIWEFTKVKVSCCETFESGASDRPLILEKGSYVPRANWFLRFLDNKREDGELMRLFIDEGPYKRKEIPDPNNESKTIPEPISKIIKRLMQGTDISQQKRHSRLMKEFDKFAAVEGESSESVYERFATLINLYDHVSQFEPHVNASKANKAARNHDPLALVANLNVYSSHSHASSSYSHSPQPYYVTHHSSVIDYEDDYQREIQGDAKEDKLTTAMMLLDHSTEHILLRTKDEAEVHLDEEENDFLLDNAYGDNTL
uniref:Uncharacterized protein n=1 Tax=Tanacetum cinerariifolium TaxID=118510 RepID=A0A6L2M1V3_TANCI|nr:hypothetical protein [Tanacetum cinerariifolium]